MGLQIYKSDDNPFEACLFQAAMRRWLMYYLRRMMLYSYASLQEFAKRVFLSIGCDDEQADLAARVLLSADLRGIDSHGMARLPGYVRLWEVKRVVPSNRPFIMHESPSTALVDGNGALGLTVAPFAMQVAIEKARLAGTGWVSVQNSSHFGIAGYHAMMCLEHDMIGICMTNASPLVAPTFSRERLLGTNPIAMAVPAGAEPPFVADFATTTASNGKLEILQRKNEDAPEGWIQDQNGMVTCDAHSLKTGGALLPLGGDRQGGSHKGYMLGSMVDILSAVLSGANFGPWVPPFPAYVPMPENMPGRGIGHFFGAMRIDAFRPAADFKKDMDQWISRFRSSAATEGNRVLIPGDPERELEKERLARGIPIDNQVVEQNKLLADRFGLSLPEEIR